MASRRRSRLILVLLAALFLLPLAGAWMITTYFPAWRPFGQANHGQLLEPPRAVDPDGLRSPDGEALAAGFFTGRWTLVLATSGRCGPPCRDALHKLRQVRLALGEDLRHVQRLWVIRGARAEGVEAATARYPGLHVARARRWPTDRHAADGILLVDPAGLYMMRYPLDADAEGMVEDLERLLEARGAA